MIKAAFSHRAGAILMAAFIAVTAVVYWPGLKGGWLFDDYPNIVDNRGIQPADASLPLLIRAAFSSPSSELKRPLASLSFAANYLLGGLDPYWMKLTNLFIHLLNGLLVFVLMRRTLAATNPSLTRNGVGELISQHQVLAALIAGGWLLLPINVTAVLYVVQRMESLANLFVLAGLIGYLAGRQRMLAEVKAGYWKGLALCILSCFLPVALGVLAKETAIMLPLYAATMEWVLFQFRRADKKRDAWLLFTFLVMLVAPLALGLAWLVPDLLRPSAWATRDFTLSTRLLSEARIVTDYIGWTLLPTPKALSFYHDDFEVSAGLLSPWTTLTSMVALACVAAIAIAQRRRQPLFALGLLLYLGCHLLTGTILPLELVYEHRNYFASIGLLSVVVPVLSGFGSTTNETLRMPRRVLLAGLLLLWGSLTALTASAWSSPLSLAQELAARAPKSPRAQYELGRTYIIYSHYDPASPFTRLAYAPLERAAAMPESSILPQQALIFMNARMGLPLKDQWWDSMLAKLRARKPGVQDESSLGALVQCARSEQCELPKQRMVDAFLAALSHPNPSPRLLAAYGDYAWNVLGDRNLGERMAREAVQASPGEPAYRITIIRMLVARGQYAEARKALQDLETLNLGGRLDDNIAELSASLPSRDR